MAEQPAPEFWSFPTDPGLFDDDERISFSRLDNKYIAVQEDGTEYEFDKDLKRWIPAIDDALIEQQQSGYLGPWADAEEDHGSRGPKGKKRKKDEREDSEGGSRNGKRQNVKPAQPRRNTAVYVTGLPLDTTVEEVNELFSRKCGVIAEEIDSGRPRIKLYTDSKGNFKGDALVVFFKPQSVEMAVMLLDDTDFRFTASGMTTGKMRVQPADLSYKKTNYDAAAASGEEDKTGAGGAAAGRDQGPTAKAPNSSNGSGRSEADKEKIKKKTQKLAAKLADWDDDEPSAMPLEAKAAVGKAQKVVILRHMFTLKELEEDPAALLDIKEDIRDECAKLGPVTNVVLFDLEEDGVVSVKFRTTEAAQACVDLMNGRAFAGRTVEAVIATGKEKLNKSKKGDNEGQSDED